MKYLSLGGWCGTTMSLRDNGLYDKAYPFDNNRSTFKGVIDCIETDFSNFFPSVLKREIIEGSDYQIYRGKYFGFYHHDLSDPEVIETFKKRIERFNDLLFNCKDKVIFVRTVISHDYREEIALTDKFISAVRKKYIDLEFALIFVIPGQAQTSYYKQINNIAFIFTVDDDCRNLEMGKAYRPIYELICSGDLFSRIPKAKTLPLKTGFNKYAEVEGMPAVKSD